MKPTAVPVVLDQLESKVNMMKIVVMKYGGTSVATEESREKIANHVIACRKKGEFPVVVVSAIGRKGDPYATDTLINLLPNPQLDYMSRDMDLLMSCGETISAVILSNLLKTKGEKAVALTGYQAGILTNNAYGDANVINVQSEAIQKYLMDEHIVIVTGFQGMDNDKNVTTLGRGGSDTTAAILGEALNADRIEIYTDVDGVMTADPRVVKNAQVIDNINFDEVYQMAKDGAKVVDHKAVAIAKRANKPLYIKNTFSEAEGTRIDNDETSDKNQEKVLTAIACKKDIVQVTVEISSLDKGNEELLNAMEKERISIDMINFFDQRKVFTINGLDLDKMEVILKKLGADYKFTTKCSKITAIGHRIHGVPGVMRRIVFALASQNIDILQTSDSNTTIACLIARNHVDNAMNVLHREFGLEK